jgi:methylenetetrahydrofolate dehydrogenase (NADP+)/methenyltetrahydrofolate cyclohydrolase
MTIIDGKLLAENLRHKIANEVRQFSRPLGLAVILVSDDEASQVYVRNKSKACIEVGFYSDALHKSANIT